MLNMKLIKTDTGAEVKLIGYLDATNAKDAQIHLVEAANRFDNLTLDLEKLEYISSAGLRALRESYLTMRRKGGKYLVKSVTKPVMEVFEITGFAGMLTFI